MDFYAGATETALFVLTGAGKVYKVEDVAAQEMDGPKVNLVKVPFESVIDVAVNWLDEALIIVNGRSGIAQCAFGYGAYQLTLDSAMSVKRCAFLPIPFSYLKTKSELNVGQLPQDEPIQLTAAIKYLHEIGPLDTCSSKRYSSRRRPSGD